MRSPHGASAAAAAPVVVAGAAAAVVAAAAEEDYDVNDDPEAAVASVIAEHDYFPFSALKIYTFCARHARRRTLFDALRISCGVELFAARAIICAQPPRCYMPRSLRGMPGQEV